MLRFMTQLIGLLDFILIFIDWNSLVWHLGKNLLWPKKKSRAVEYNLNEVIFDSSAFRLYRIRSFLSLLYNRFGVNNKIRLTYTIKKIMFLLSILVSFWTFWTNQPGSRNKSKRAQARTSVSGILLHDKPETPLGAAPFDKLWTGSGGLIPAYAISYLRCFESIQWAIIDGTYFLSETRFKLRPARWRDALD